MSDHHQEEEDDEHQMVDQEEDDKNQASARPKRHRDLTEKGQELLDKQINTYSARLQKLWKNVDTIIEEVDHTSSKNPELIIHLKSQLETRIDAFDVLFSEFCGFLERHRTEKCVHELQKLKFSKKGYSILFDTAFRKLNALYQQSPQLHEQKPPQEEDVHSNRSTKRSQENASQTSSISSKQSSLSEKRKKAEIARAKLKYTELEMKIKKEQSLLALERAKSQKMTDDLEADLQLLSVKKEVAVAEAEILSEEEGSQCGHSDTCIKHLESVDSKERTKSYVEQHAQIRTQNKNICVEPETIVKENVNQHSQSCIPEPCTSILNPQALPYFPPQPSWSVGGQAVTSDFTRYLLKKDLMLSRLIKFNDKPEFYPSWKATFKSVMRDLQVTPEEEIDFLIKFTSLSAQQQIISIKAASASNPVHGLQRIWQRLEERFGCPEMIESALKTKLNSFAPITSKDYRRLYDLSDILDEILAAKEDIRYQSLLAYFDASTGVTPIVMKLPYQLQEKWTNTAVKYISEHHVVFPPFHVFANFIREQSRIKNNPSFAYTDRNLHMQKHSDKTLKISSRKTAVSRQPQILRNSGKENQCPLHKTNHSLEQCRAFRTKPFDERRKILKDNNLCYRCCSRDHKQAECHSDVQCGECGSKFHTSPLHVNRTKVQTSYPWRNYGGENFTERQVLDSENVNNPAVNSKCTQICGQTFGGKSCAKTILVHVYPKHCPQKSVKIYAVIDDQSNRTLAKPELFDLMDTHGTMTNYLLTSCSGKVQRSGRKVHGLVVESLDGQNCIDIPTIIECDEIPEVREEIPTPDVALHYEHLHDIADHIPPVDPNAEILLLIGRDITKAHHVLDQRIGLGNQPYAQKLSLGWTIIGETCLGKTHKPDVINVMKTCVLPDGRPTLMLPCNSNLQVKEKILNETSTNIMCTKTEIGESVFQRTENDEKLGLSMDDHEFLDIMNSEFTKDLDGHWQAPLPFRKDRQRLVNNYDQARKRAKQLDYTLQKDPTKKEHFVEFMDALFKNHHAEIAPPLQNGEECWYLPLFGVYNPKKPNKIRVVFDSSAKFEGKSLNDVLLTGPDLTNSLLGVLLRFRREKVALIGDIEQMFYCFKVCEPHRNFLRFLWHEDNNPEKRLIEYRMTVHVFGNSPSPAIATYGLRKTVKEVEDMFGTDVTQYVERDFYVDDGLTSQPTVEKAVDLMKRTQKALSYGKLRLHKIASNNQEVMNAFPPSDLSSEMKDLDLSKDNLPTQRSLGLNWDLQSDSFFFKISNDVKPFTRRGVLSTINSIFDPLGFLAPIIIQGKSLMRNLLQETVNWDEPLPENQSTQWEKWKNSLQHLQNLHIPRVYIELTQSWSETMNKTIHIFCDASESAISAVAYVESQGNFGFILGKSKLAPLKGHSIPRLELCGAVLAVEIAKCVSEQLELPIEHFKFYYDSKVVLGYIFNNSRRFYQYVANRVMQIRKVTKPDQWSYISTDKNPADQATRQIPVKALQNSTWLLGPSPAHLQQIQHPCVSYEMVDPDSDREVRQEITCLKVDISRLGLKSERFSCFSQWRKLVETIARLQHIAHSFQQGDSKCSGWHVCEDSRTVENFNKAEKLIIKIVQNEVYLEEIQCILKEKPLPRDSNILPLSPFLDKDGILRVGGRLNKSSLPINEKNPVIIPRNHHIALLIVRYYHELCKHQGRHLTAGAIRSAGFWIIGARKLVSSILHNCVKCRKLRGKLLCQKMSDLPTDRLEPSPPFTYIGLDTFGPWEIVTRRTRGGSANSKRWAILFTCLTTRRIHIEVVEELSSSSFINAFKRFEAIRGKVTQIRSDQGTNFVGAINDLKIDSTGLNLEDGKIKNFLYECGTTWKFNPPHSSHMGGAWERLIGVVRRVIDAGDTS
ncbi:uncharacterized protein LOC133180435 [Saccostrea echinata]|uniref:uncharacterized protein LOC133180435 n=1 Tax=Saccostrea echinata TaxID=191078 RepID=UPI002A84198D|nr:uncharacterized protein LOC133180435 [Saccostrea echinata]